jgi:hypothetical protein
MLWSLTLPNAILANSNIAPYLLLGLMHNLISESNIQLTAFTSSRKRSYLEFCHEK